MEIKSTLQNYCKENKIAAAYVITCVGSVTQVHLRMAHSPKTEHNVSKLLKQHFEIVSLGSC